MKLLIFEAPGQPPIAEYWTLEVQKVHGFDRYDIELLEGGSYLYRPGDTGYFLANGETEGVKFYGI